MRGAKARTLFVGKTDHNGAQNGDWANVLLSDASRVLGLDPLAAFAVEWEDDEEAATA
jgi:hypothetical protein